MQISDKYWCERPGFPSANVCNVSCSGELLSTSLTPHIFSKQEHIYLDWYRLMINFHPTALLDEELSDDVSCVRRIYLETAQLSGFPLKSFPNIFWSFPQVTDSLPGLATLNIAPIQPFVPTFLKIVSDFSLNIGKLVFLLFLHQIYSIRPCSTKKWNHNARPHHFKVNWFLLWQEL